MYSSDRSGLSTSVPIIASIASRPAARRKRESWEWVPPKAPIVPRGPEDGAAPVWRAVMLALHPEAPAARAEYAPPLPAL